MANDCQIPFFESKEISSQEIGSNIITFNLPKAWEYSQGEGIIIAVIDSGCDLDHLDLKNNLVEGKNFIEDGPPYDKFFHGTHVTGILVAENNDIGVVGICPKAKVMPIKALDNSGNGNIANITKAIRWAADHKADFISISFGSIRPIPHVRRAIQYAARKNVITFAAAGNAGNNSSLLFPAAYPEVISVAAATNDFCRADFSNIDVNLNFMAPGVDVLSTIPNNKYAKMSGSSMAQPFVCGLAALVKSYMIKNNIPLLKTAAEYCELFSQYAIETTDCLKIIDPRKFIEQNFN